jgi:hypothetical protein
MRLSDAGLRQRQTKALYLNHRSTPWLTEDATRDRSNRLLGVEATSKNTVHFGRTIASGHVILVSNKAPIYTFKTKQSAIVESNNKPGLQIRPIFNGKAWRALIVVNYYHDSTYLVIVNHAMPYTDARRVVVKKRWHR